VNYETLNNQPIALGHPKFVSLQINAEAALLTLLLVCSLILWEFSEQLFSQRWGPLLSDPTIPETLRQLSHFFHLVGLSCLSLGGC
jgi:hypothetical protein